LIVKDDAVGRILTASITCALVSMI